MARLQILELPEGPEDSRRPFVLVVDEYAPRRYVLGTGQTGEPRSEFHGVAETIGARAILTFVEQVEIPANALLPVEGFELRGEGDDEVDLRERKFSDRLKEYAEAQHRELVDREDAITDALGIDRLRDWERIVEIVKDMRTHALQGEYVDGHLFGIDPPRCCRCGISRTDWVVRRATPTCDAVLLERGRN